MVLMVNLNTVNPAKDSCKWDDPQLNPEMQKKKVWCGIIGIPKFYVSNWIHQFITMGWLGAWRWSPALQGLRLDPKSLAFHRGRLAISPGHGDSFQHCVHVVLRISRPDSVGVWFCVSWCVIVCVIVYVCVTWLCMYVYFCFKIENPKTTPHSFIATLVKVRVCVRMCQVKLLEVNGQTDTNKDSSCSTGSRSLLVREINSKKSTNAIWCFQHFFTVWTRVHWEPAACMSILSMCSVVLCIIIFCVDQSGH